MVFNNVLFLFGFLPVTWLLVQRLKNPKAKNIALLAASLLFYAFGSWKDLGVLLIMGIWTYVSALEMEADPQNRKPVFIASVAVEIAVLCFYKYIPYWFSDLKIGFPIGISFYTFSAISYLADIYMKKAPLQTDPVAFGLYLAFFGKVNMGPISEYHQMENQLSRRVCTHKKTGEGLLLFTRGLVKKVVFADQLAVAYTLLRADDSWLGAWLLTLVYTFQLYFDFSGYSDMAIGLGKMFGFDIPINFDHPYIAKSVKDFWRRWHIALSTWFRDYVYIPLGGSRAGKRNYIRNILIVWLLTGIWHGPSLTYVVWGLYYGGLLLLEHFALQKPFEKLPDWLRVLAIFLVANIGWVFFSSPNLGAAFGQLGRLIGIGIGASASQTALFALSNYGLLLLASFAFSTRLFERVEAETITKRYGETTWLALYLLAFAVCVVFIIGSTSNSFLYFAF